MTLSIYISKNRQIFSLFYAFCFATIILLLLHVFQVRSDFENYIFAFSNTRHLDLFTSLTSNEFVIYIFSNVTSLFDFSPELTASFLYAFQAFLHSYIFSYALGPFLASLVLFSDLQQIDLNQVRYGLSMDFIALLYLLPCMIRIKSISFNVFSSTTILPIKGFLSALIGFILHFQSILISLYLLSLRIPLYVSLLFVSLLASSIPLIINTLGFTARYINQPLVERVLPLNLYLYIPSCLLLSFAINSISTFKPMLLKMGHLKLLSLPSSANSYLKGVLPLSLFICIFFAISSSAVYQGRMITGLYSSLIYVFVISLARSIISLETVSRFMRSNILLLLLFLVTGVYRVITLFGSIYSVV